MLKKKYIFLQTLNTSLLIRWLEQITIIITSRNNLIEKKDGTILEIYVLKLYVNAIK